MEGIGGAEAQAFRTYVTDQREQWQSNEQRWDQMFSHMDQVQARLKQLEDATEKQSKMNDMAQAAPSSQTEAKVNADGVSQIDGKVDAVQQQLLKQMRANEDQLSQVCGKIEETMKKSVDDRMDVKLAKMLEEISVATFRATQQFANTVIKHVEGSQEALKTHATELSKELMSQSKRNSKQESEDLMQSVQGKLQVAFRDVVSSNDSQWHKIEQSFKQLEERFQADRTVGPKADPKKYQTPCNNGEEELERLRCGNDETLRELEQLFQKARKTESLHKESLDLVQQESYKHQTTEEAARKWRAWNEKYRHETASDDGTNSQCGSEQESDLGSAFRNRIDAGTDVSSDAGSIDTLDLERQVKYMVADCEDFNSGVSTPTQHYRS